MLVALVADDVRVVHSIQVLCTDHRYVQPTHWPLNEVPMRLLSLSELFACLLQTRVIGQDVLLDL